MSPDDEFHPPPPKVTETQQLWSIYDGVFQMIEG